LPWRTEYRSSTGIEHRYVEHVRLGECYKQLHHQRRCAGFWRLRSGSANKTGDQPGTATLAVDCTNGASAVITLGQGANADTGSTDAAPLRRLKAGSDYLSYTLWQDSGRTTTPWGNTAGTGEEYAGVGTSENVSVYAAISGAQTSVHAGSFADTVVATITF